MAKLITVKRAEDDLLLARAYVKSFILLPSGVLGLVCMIAGLGTLGYQLIAGDAYTAGTFMQSSGLLLAGGFVGYLQTKYHRYLLTEFPAALAARMRAASARTSGKVRKAPAVPSIEHRGRNLVPAAYILGTLVLLATSIVTAAHGEVDPVPSLLMPWAGFYWARLFFWRRVLQ